MFHYGYSKSLIRPAHGRENCAESRREVPDTQHHQACTEAQQLRHSYSYVDWWRGGQEGT